MNKFRKHYEVFSLLSNYINIINRAELIRAVKTTVCIEMCVFGRYNTVFHICQNRVGIGRFDEPYEGSVAMGFSVDGEMNRSFS